MKTEELIFANEQIAEMITAGIPLEGALKKVAQDMRKGKLSREIEELTKDLENGTPFEDAVKNRNFPEFYRKMLIVGGKTDNLPQTLNLIADYYRRRSELVMRLTGILFYPVIIFIVALVITVFLEIITNNFKQIFEELLEGEPLPGLTEIAFYAPYISLFICILMLLVFVVTLSKYVKWNIPPFKEMNLVNFSTMISICLKSGFQLPEALDLVAGLEGCRTARRQMIFLKNKVEEGKDFTEAILATSLFPDLYKWVIKSFGKNPVEGFNSAAKLYFNRARYRTEFIFNLILPVSFVILGGVVVLTIWGYILPLISIIEKLGG